MYCFDSICTFKQRKPTFAFRVVKQLVNKHVNKIIDFGKKIVESIKSFFNTGVSIAFA